MGVLGEFHTLESDWDSFTNDVKKHIRLYQDGTWKEETVPEDPDAPEVGSTETTNPVGPTPPIPGPMSTEGQPEAETVPEPETEKPEGS